MIEWSEQHQMIRDALRRFVEAEIAPQVEALEHGDLPPYEILRKMFRTFGLDELARARFRGQMKREESGAEPRESKRSAASRSGEASASRGDAAAMPLLAIIELCRHCPGMVTAMGVSVGLAAAAILSKGTRAQKERWALDLLTFDKIGAWAITEPDSGSDAFGSMKSTARRDGQGGYLLNGTKTFITNGPYADTIVFICKLDEPGVERRPTARCSRSCSTAACRGSRRASRCARWACTRRRPASSSSRTCTRARTRLLGESEAAQSRSGAKATFSIERTGVAAMALGIVERCLELSLAYARERVQFGRPIGEFQLIQDKLARMEVARMNLQNLVFRQIELAAAGRTPTLAEASAMKLYSARAAMEVALEAVQVYGGNGYMAEYRVEQLARDAKVLQIYAGTDEIQISRDRPVAARLVRSAPAATLALRLKPGRSDVSRARSRTISRQGGVPSHRIALHRAAAARGRSACDGRRAGSTDGEASHRSEPAELRTPQLRGVADGALAGLHVPRSARARGGVGEAEGRGDLRPDLVPQLHAAPPAAGPAPPRARVRSTPAPARSIRWCSRARATSPSSRSACSSSTPRRTNDNQIVLAAEDDVEEYVSETVFSGAGDQVQLNVDLTPLWDPAVFDVIPGLIVRSGWSQWDDFHGVCRRPPAAAARDRSRARAPLRCSRSVSARSRCAVAAPSEPLSGRWLPLAAWGRR